jgi:hypothetical protein
MAGRSIFPHKMSDRSVYDVDVYHVGGHVVLGGAITAYLIFGEKFTHWIQWLGVLFALGAAICINYDCSNTS